MKKTITIDEKAIYDAILSRLDKTYTLAYADPYAEIPAGIIQKCVDSRSLDPLYGNDYWWEARYHASVEELDRILMETLEGDKDKAGLFRETAGYDDLACLIRERDDSTPEIDTLRRTEPRAYLRFHSNYDCWLPLREYGGRLQAQGTALTAIMDALSLNPWRVRQAAGKAGITTVGPFRNIPSRNDNEVVDYDEFIRCLMETPGYGNWAFFGKLDMGALADNGMDPERMTIPKGTVCGMINWWNGSGSYEFCETVRPVDVKTIARRLGRHKDGLKLVVDEKENNMYGYVPCDIYGDNLSNKTLLV